MPRPAAASVRVFAAGQPARGLRVIAKNGFGGEQDSDRTDAQGLARLNTLLSGPIKVIVLRGHEQLAVREVQLLPGPNAEIAIEVTL